MRGAWDVVSKDGSLDQVGKDRLFGSVRAVLFTLGKSKQGRESTTNNSWSGIHGALAKEMIAKGKLQSVPAADICSQERKSRCCIDSGPGS